MRSSRAHTDDDGFTMVELIVAIALAAFVFTALASVMLGSLSAVGIQKSRTRGNDIATVAIEDLQRLSYNALGTCAAPSGTATPELADTVLLPNCTGATVKYGPCDVGSQPANSVPDEEFACVNRSLTYNVKRYIAYGDVAHTEKRLAVVVEWTDEGGKHRVAQQSSLRIPSQNANIGLVPPVVASAGTGVLPSATDLQGDGTNAASLTLTATTTGVTSTAGDTVIAVFDTVSDSGRQQQSVALAPNGSNNWQTTVLPGALRLGMGSQFVTFTATRVSDGKVNSRIVSTPFVTNGTPAFAPTLAVAQQPPATGSLNAQGDLTSAAFNIAVTTTNVSPSDGVAMSFETTTGAVSLSMQPDAFVGGSCTVALCQTTWRASISPAAGYHFAPGDLYFYVVARQSPAGGAYTVDSGATAAVRTTKITLS